MILVDFNQIAIGSVMVSLHRGAELSEDFVKHLILNQLRFYRSKFFEEYGELVICCDSKHYWRRDYFPNYKVNRKKRVDKESSFENISAKKFEEKKTKINNKIIHQSKLLKYFEKEKDINQTQEDLDKLLKSIKKNKDYFVSTKDLILLESLISDGIEIKKKYKNMFKFDQSIIPTDLQMLLNNNEEGMILLRLVEIIGEDNLENLDADTLYFMTSILNELNLDSIRNKLLLEVLPLKI